MYDVADYFSDRVIKTTKEMARFIGGAVGYFYDMMVEDGMKFVVRYRLKDKAGTWWGCAGCFVARVDGDGFDLVHVPSELDVEIEFVDVEFHAFDLVLLFSSYGLMID